MLHLRPGSAYLKGPPAALLLFAVTPGNDAGSVLPKISSGQTRSQLSVYCTPATAAHRQQREAPEQAAGIASIQTLQKCRAADEDIAMLVINAANCSTYQSMAACSGNPSPLAGKREKSGRTNAAAKRNRDTTSGKTCA